MFVRTGDYTTHTHGKNSRATYYTFTPIPLMEGNFYAMNDALAVLLASAHRSFGILEGMSFALPNADKAVFSKLMSFRESCFSKMIDYSDFQITSELMERNYGKNSSGIQSIMSAYEYALTSNKVSFSGIANLAMNGTDSNKKIAVRNEQTFWQQTSSNYQQYNPTAPKQIAAALTDISEYMKSSPSDALIVAAMCHYQFEIIHPYERYNGILGRILISKVLSQAGVPGVQYVSISQTLYAYRDEYFGKLGQTQKCGDYIAWIEFFIQTVNKSTRHSIDLMKFYLELVDRDEEYIITFPKNREDHALDVYRYFKSEIVSSIGRASKQLNLSFGTVSRSVETLIERRILTQISGGSRNRLFAYRELMEHLVNVK